MDQPTTASPQSGSGGYRFIPPRHHPLMMGLARLITPLYLRFVTRIDRVEISPEDRRRLKELLGRRAILTPNHPSYDPAVVMQLSGMLGTGFYFLAAREVFDNPLQRFVCSRVGAYSINRGAQDSDSLHATRQLLHMGRRWLVIFPEGQEYYLHDIVLPFLPGAARFGYGALEDLQREGRSEPVYLIPLIIRYHYRQNVDHHISESLGRLEQALGLPAGSGPLFGRVLRVTYCLLEINERLYEVDVPDPEDIDGRISRLRETVLTDVERKLGVAPGDPQAPLRNRLRKLFVAVSEMRRSALSAYEKRLLDSRARTMRHELERVLEFVAMPGRYVEEHSSAERYLDLLSRFEMEVFGKLRFFGPRTARISMGEPINLAESYATWQREGEKQAERVTLQLEEAVRRRLEEMCTEHWTKVGRQET